MSIQTLKTLLIFTCLIAVSWNYLSSKSQKSSRRTTHLNSQTKKIIVQSQYITKRFENKSVSQLDVALINHSYLENTIVSNKHISLPFTIHERKFSFFSSGLSPPPTFL